jgi:hypothetical protein
MTENYKLANKIALGIENMYNIFNSNYENNNNNILIKINLDEIDKIIVKDNIFNNLMNKILVQNDNDNFIDHKMLRIKSYYILYDSVTYSFNKNKEYCFKNITNDCMNYLENLIIPFMVNKIY